MAYLHIALTVLSGLVLFLFALNYLSDGLQTLSGERLNAYLARFTRNILTGIVAGVVITTLLDSSSVVIIMTIALVNARALTFRQAMGVVLGANIGTTFSSQLIALDVGQWAGLPMLTGFLMLVATQRESIKQWGKVVLGLGMLFLGLYLMEEAVEPLKKLPQVTAWMKGLESPWRGALVGAGATVLLQSSSATVGMAVVLAGQKLLTLPAGVAIMMGAELGTCADTLVASLGRSRAAVKTGLFHLSFNLLSILIGLLLMQPFTNLVEWTSGGAPLGRQLANAHVLFNALGVLIAAPLVPLAANWLERLVPEKPKHRRFPN